MDTLTEKEEAEQRLTNPTLRAIPSTSASAADAASSSSINFGTTTTTTTFAASAVPTQVNKKKDIGNESHSDDNAADSAAVQLPSKLFSEARRVEEQGQSSQQQQQQRRTKTGNMSMAQDKGKQRNLQDQESTILVAPPTSHNDSSSSNSKTSKSCKSKSSFRPRQDSFTTTQVDYRIPFLPKTVATPPSLESVAASSSSPSSSSSRQHQQLSSQPRIEGHPPESSIAIGLVASTYSFQKRSGQQSVSQGASSSSANMMNQPDQDASVSVDPSVIPTKRKGGPSAPLESESRRYLLHILQEPTTGCAFGSHLLSRLALAPPLIVQLQAIDRAGREVSLEEDLPFLVCHVHLTTEDGRPADMLTPVYTTTPAPPPEEQSSTTETAGAPATASTQENDPITTLPSALPGQAISTSSNVIPASVRMLYGTLIASPMLLYTPDDRPAIIFVFPEISIRSRGRFRLHISLMKLPLPIPGASTSHNIANASTEAFNVVLSSQYVAPHVTDLTSHFARQGVGLLLPPDNIVPAGHHAGD